MQNFSTLVQYSSVGGFMNLAVAINLKYIPMKLSKLIVF